MSENSNTRVFIGIGTNVGDRSNYIDRALDKLRLEDQIWIEAVSSIYETVPVGLQMRLIVRIPHFYRNPIDPPNH